MTVELSIQTSEQDTGARCRVARSFDVIIFGASTAGLMTAIALAGRTRLRVAVVNRPGSSGIRASERLSEGGKVVLTRHGLWRQFLVEHHAQVMARGTSAADGVNQTFIYDPSQSGWTVQRSWFDEMLAREAHQRGVPVWSSCHLVAGATAADLVVVPPAAPPVRIGSRFVIDASGPRAVYARRRGARRQVVDQLASVTVRFAVNEPATAPKVEPWSEGWWYSDQRPDGNLLVSCLTEPRRVRPLRLKSLDGWWERLEQTDWTRRRVQDAWARSTPIVESASCHRLEPILGHDWLAIDEAISGQHPLGGLGLERTLINAERAAEAVGAHLEGGASLAPYGHRVASDDSRHRRALAGYYAEERFRFPNRDFWQHRRSLAAH